MAAVARKAGVSRITVYNVFGSRAKLIEQLIPSQPQAPSEAAVNPREELRQLLLNSCARWAVNPALFRHLPSLPEGGEGDRGLAERLANADALRPGCSIKEAADVIGALASFPVFDRLHHDGRRSPAAVAEILIRLAGSLLG